MELIDTGETLRLFNPKTKQLLLTSTEERQARQQAEVKLSKVQTELAKLREQIKKLKNLG